MSIVGLLHPGEMGAAVAALLRAREIEVLWASAGRSEATANRAAAAGLVDAGSVEEVAARSDVVLSICPPHGALDVARSVAGFGGLYVDANAISPATAREVAATVEAGGATYVDGGIVGGPPREAGDGRLYLSGEAAGEVADLFAGTVLEPVVLGSEPGSASALKMAYAGYSKGTAALLLALREAARAEGVEDALLAEWATSIPGLEERSERARSSAEAKGWRWVAEMEEIAATLERAGQPGGFHRAAAEIFRRF